MSSVQNYRPLSELEQSIINRLLEKSFPGRDVLIKQARALSARSTEDTDNYGSVYLKTSVKDKAPVDSRVPVEAVTQDTDGAEVLVLLHVAEGYLDELEIVKSDGSSLLGRINASEMKITIRN